MEKLIVLGIMVVAVVWYFKSKKNKSKNVKDTIQEEFTETCCSKSSEDKVEVNLSKTTEDKVEVSLEKYITPIARTLKLNAPINSHLIISVVFLAIILFNFGK